MGLFKKANQQQQAGKETQLSPVSDPEQPGIKSAASAPGSTDHQLNDQQQLRSHSEPAPLKKRHSGQPQKDTLTEDQRQTLEHIQLLTKVMDNAITIPVIKKKFGLDAMLGLIPYAGDMAGATVGTYIITRALKYNMPKRLVLRMMLNQAIDSAVGVIPFIGDIFDFGFKANARNMKLLQEHLEHPKQAKRADTCFLFLMFFLVVVVPVVLVVGGIAAIVLGILAALNKL